MRHAIFWAGLALCAGRADAQDPPAPPRPADTVLPTITVTATKRDQKAMEVIGSLDTATPEDLGPRGLYSVDQLDRVFTDMNIRQRSSRAYTNVTLRGQSSVDFYNPAAQLYVDGLPQDPALFAQLLPQDLAQVEVLYGPQGSLYGRGAVGGVLSVTTRRPDAQRRAQGVLDLNSHGHGAQLLLNLPLADDGLFADLALASRRERGEMREMGSGARLGDGEALNGRLRLRYAPRDSALELMLSAAHSRQDSSEEHFVAGPDLARREALPVPSRFRLETHSLGLVASYALGPVTLSSLTGYQDRDFDRTIFASATPEAQKTFSQEFRLASRHEPGAAIDYVAGLYLQTLDFRREVPAAQLSSRQDIRSQAAFGELTWHATARLDAVAGLRVERERAQADTALGSVPLGGRKRFSASSPKLGLNYRWSEDLAVHGLYSTGFKAGGFTRAVTPQTVAHTYQPQHTRNLELGFKAALLAQRLELTGTAYLMETRDYQLSVGPVQGQYLQNVGEVRTRGLSLGARWQATPRLHVKAGWALNDSFFSHYDNPANPGVDLKGRQLPYAPRATANLAAEYVIPLSGADGGGRLVPRLAASYVGRSYFNEANTVGQKAYALLDLGVSWRLNRHLSIDVYVDNAADRVHALYAFEAGAPFGTLYQLGRGRTVGVRVDARL